MPKQERWYVKRRFDQTITHIQKAQDIMVETGQMYKEPHPDYYERFSDIVHMFEVVQTLLKKFRDDI